MYADAMVQARMQAPYFSFFLLLALLASGCTFHRSVTNAHFAKLDTSWIKPGVTTRAEVIARFGLPPLSREAKGMDANSLHYLTVNEFTGRLEAGYIVTPTFEASAQSYAEDTFINFDARGVVTLVSRTHTDMTPVTGERKTTILDYKE